MIRLVLCALAALPAAPATAEVIATSPGHFVSRNSVVVKPAAKDTWLVLIDPAGWWADSHTWSGSAKNMSLTPQGGGCFCERIPEEDGASQIGLAGSAQHMTVVMADPLKVLRMRGALGPLQSEPVDGVLTITLQPDKASGGTKLTMEYVVGGQMRYEVPKISKAVDEVMAQQLGRLADKLGRAAVPAAEPVKPAAEQPKPAAQPAEPAREKPAADSPGDVGAALDAMEKKRAADPK